MTHLLLVHIGPVQGFIISSRRTRDFWFGSELLSRLSKKVAEVIANEYGVESLIFPAPVRPENLEKLKVANKIVALIDEKRKSPEVIGQEIREEINDLVNLIKEDVYAQVHKKIEQDKSKQVEFKTEVADAQIADFMEYFWVAISYDEQKDTYAAKRHQLELLMAARKNMRDFRHVTWSGKQPKSSIDGQLESVIPQAFYPHRSMSDDVQNHKKALLYTIFRAGPAEHLSGVDLLKRLGTFKEEFRVPSTSHLAAIPYLQRIARLQNIDEARQRWQKYIAMIKDVTNSTNEITVPLLERVGGYHPDSPDYRHPHPIIDRFDGSLFFPERFLQDGINKEQFGSIKIELEEFLKYINEQPELAGKKLCPAPYYAILQADGDGMGEVIDHIAEAGPAEHQKFSRQLDIFADSADKIVREHLGALVYSGGDDVLALLPVHKAVDCAAALSQKFCKELSSFHNKDGASPTLSVGIAIVHHVELLQDALSTARRAETQAKGVKEKNALAIILSKRSGEEYPIKGHWGDVDTFLTALIARYRDNTIPKGTAYELRDMALRLDGLHIKLRNDSPEDDQSPHHAEVVSAALLRDAARRTLKRKLTAEKLGKEKTKATLNMLMLRLGQAPDGQEKPIPPVRDLEEFIHELIVAEMLADAQELAGLPMKEVN